MSEREFLQRDLTVCRNWVVINADGWSSRLPFFGFATIERRKEVGGSYRSLGARSLSTRISRLGAVPRIAVVSGSRKEKGKEYDATGQYPPRTSGGAKALMTLCKMRSDINLTQQASFASGHHVVVSIRSQLCGHEKE